MSKCKLWLGLLGFAIVHAAMGGLVFSFENTGRPGTTPARLPEASGAAYELQLRQGSGDAPVATDEGLRINRGLVWVRNPERNAVAAPFTLHLSLQSPARPEPIPIAASGDWLLTVDYRAGKLTVKRSGDDRAASLAAPLAADRRQLLTMVADGDKVTFYLDAAPVGAVETAAPLEIRRDLYFGSSNSAGKGATDGLIGGIALWDQALTAAQIKALGDGTKPSELNLAGLTRTVTTPLPADLKPFVPKRTVELLRDGRPAAVIVDSERRPGMPAAAEVAAAFRTRWGVEFPVLPPDQARKSGKTMILVGGTRETELAIRLRATGHIGDNAFGHELRTIPDALDYRADILYFGGRNDENVRSALAAFFQRFPQAADTVPHFIDCPDWAAKTPAASPAELFASLKKIYDDQELWQINQEAFNILSRTANHYNMTGDDAYATVFAAMARYVSENYERGMNERKNPPTFSFHLFPLAVDMVEKSPVYSGEDQKLAAELMRRMVEQTMDYWEMILPARCYAIQQPKHFTNHYCFASRSVYFCGVFLKKRYDYTPADYWTAVAKFVFDNVSNHPFSPEDAAGYQYLGYRIFIDFALASGLYNQDFFRQPLLKAYSAYAKSLLSHLGYTAGYGDGNPLGSCSGYNVLKMALDTQNDAEAEYLLTLIARKAPADSFFRRTIDDWKLRSDLPPPGRATLGLNAFALDDFRLKELRIFGLFPLPALDKAIFRSGWDDAAEFITVAGINNAPHGHFDANGISIMIGGQHVWLVEGDYIRKQADDHNEITVNRDGLGLDHRTNFGPGNRNRASQVVAAVNSASRELSLLTLRLENHNGVDWNRTLLYAPHQGFWVVDRLTAALPGDYLVEARWRTLGKVEKTAQGVAVTQKKASDEGDLNAFSIVEGSGAETLFHSQFDYSHGYSTGYFSNYPYADGITRVITQRKRQRLEKSESVDFVNFFRPRRAGEKAPELRQLAPQAYLMPEADFPQLLVIGSFKHGELEIDADVCLINGRGIVGTGIRKVKLGKLVELGAAPELAKNHAELGVEPAEIASALRELQTQGRIVANRPAATLDAPARMPALTLETAGPIAHAALTADRIALAEGNAIKVFDHAGKPVFTQSFDQPVSQIAAIDGDWAVGTGPAGNRPEAGKLHLLDGDGKIRWSAEIPAYAKRSGVVRTISAAVFAPGRPKAVVIGTDAWHYMAFDREGKPLWRTQILHGATVSAPVDLDGDGIDEIIAGNEYYAKNLIGATGKMLCATKSSPRDCAVAAVRLKDGKRQLPVAGRGDGFLYAVLPDQYDGPAKPWTANAGGRPVGLVTIPLADGEGLAAANLSGQVVRFNAGGKRLGVTALPAPLTALARTDAALFAAARDGFVYGLDFDGRVVARLALPVDPAEPIAPQLFGHGGKLLTVSGRTARLFIP